MKCPLLKGEIKLEDADVTMDFIDCLKEECAWWDDRSQQCLYITATEQLLRLANILSDIRDKMPMRSSSGGKGGKR